MTDDLIGRAEAQTAIQFAAKRYTVAHEAHGEGQVVWSDNLINVTDAMNVLRDLPSAQPEQRWIPCSERLPKESRKYLVTVFDGIGKRTTSAPYHRRSKSWTLTGRMAYWKVVAWCELPEPYQEGGEKK